jgi:hypothetical protein
VTGTPIPDAQPTKPVKQKALDPDEKFGKIHQELQDTQQRLREIQK